MKNSLYIVLIFLFVQPLQADYQFYRGVRQMGMGGASIAVVNDETSVLSNPNGLGRLRDYFFTVIDPELTTSADGSDTLLGTAVFGSANPQELYDDLSDKIAQPYYFKSQVFPSVVMQNFGIGVLGKYEVLAQRNVDGTYDYLYQNDYSLNLAYNMKFWGGRIKVGFAGHLINRVEYFGTRDPAVESLSISSFASEGMGIGVDTGLTLTAPWRYLPTLAVLVRDIGGTAFTAGGGLFGNGVNGTPQYISQSIDAAVAFSPIYGKYSRGVFTVEYTGVDDTENVTDHMDRLHIGTEVNLWDAYFLRAGWHANDWTAGLEYSVGVFQWQLATYSEEINLGTLADRDRRGVLKFAFRF